MRELMRSFRLRVRALLNRRQLERDIEDELAHHLAMRQSGATVDVRRSGAPFGNATSIRESCRDLWSFGFLEDRLRELRHAARVLRRAPGHTTAIVMLLALGIGANAAMFSLFNAFFLRQLPVDQPEQLVAIGPGWSIPRFEAFRRAQTSFNGILATGSLGGTVVATESGNQLAGVSGGIVTGNYFQVLGVRAAIGRVFTEDDDQYSDPRPVMVIGDAFWRRRFGGDPQVLGRRVLLAGSLFTIIGVTPRGFHGDMVGRVRDFWVPLNMQPVALPQGDLRNNAGYPWLSAMGRLHPGVSLVRAQSEAEAVFGRVFGARSSSRQTRAPVRLTAAANGFAGFRGRLETPLQILAGTVVIILLIVWANVATLLLARGTARQREMAVRQALGCGRARLVRQLLVEGVLLAAAGGSIGMAIAPACARVLLSLQPSFDTIAPDLSFDANMWMFALGISLVTAVAFSLTPALSASRVAIEPALKSASRGSTGPRSRQRTLRWVVAFQTALSVILVVAAFLFARSFARLQAVEAGFDREHIVSTTVSARLAGYHDDASQAQLGRRLVERLSALPGVRSASVGLCAVLMGCSRAGVLSVDGRTPSTDDPSAWINPVSANYFETSGIPIVMGRGFENYDRPGTAPVAVVTESLARYYFPGTNPLGKRYREPSGAEAFEIVGVIRDIHFVSPRDPPIHMVFLSMEQFPGPFSYVQVRTEGPPQALVAAVRRTILDVDPKLHMLGPAPLAEILDAILGRDVLLRRASALFGTIALLLACLGVYGVISYLVAARSAELGIRLAIGAQPGHVLARVLGDALRTVAPGIVVGIVGAWAASRLIESLLFGVSGRDPLTYAAVASALLLTTTLAAWLPARRASRIDPVGRCAASEPAVHLLGSAISSGAIGGVDSTRGFSRMSVTSAAIVSRTRLISTCHSRSMRAIRPHTPMACWPRSARASAVKCSAPRHVTLEVRSTMLRASASSTPTSFARYSAR